MRAPPTASLLRGAVRAARPTAMLGRRAATTHAISNPTLANIEKRWEGMPLQEQAELWMALRDRMKGPWQELTLQEKKAGACFPEPVPLRDRCFRNPMPHRESPNCQFFVTRVIYGAREMAIGLPAGPGMRR